MGTVSEAYKREETGSYVKKQDFDCGVFQSHGRDKRSSGDPGRYAVTKSAVSGSDQEETEKTETQFFREGSAACGSACVRWTIAEAE